MANYYDTDWNKLYYATYTIKDLIKSLNYYYRKFGLGKERLGNAEKWTATILKSNFKNIREAENYIKDLEIDSKYKNIDITKTVRGKSATNEMKSINKEIAKYLKIYNKFSDSTLTMKEFREQAGTVKSAYYMAENAKLKNELNKLKKDLEKINLESAKEISKLSDATTSTDLAKLVRERNKYKKEVELLVEREKERQKTDRINYENKVYSDIKRYQDQASDTIDWYLDNPSASTKLSKFRSDMKILDKGMEHILSQSGELSGDLISDTEDILNLERYSEITNIYKLLKNYIKLNASSDFRNLSIEEQLDEINELNPLESIYNDEELNSLKETLKNINETSLINYLKTNLYSSPEDIVKKVKDIDINKEMAKDEADIVYTKGATQTVSESEFICFMDSGWYVAILLKDLKLPERRINELLNQFRKETGVSFEEDISSKYQQFYKWLLSNYQTLLVNQANSILFNKTKDRCNIITNTDSVDTNKAVSLEYYFNNYQK